MKILHQFSMDSETIEHVLHDTQVDPVSGVPFSAIIFMLYYGLELNHLLLDIADEFIKKVPLKEYHVGISSTYLSGSAAEGLYLNTRRIAHARDIDIVTIWRKYPIKEKCEFDELFIEEWLLKLKSEREEGCACGSDIQLNMTINECDDRYLNIKVLPDTPPGYVLLQKCRRHPLPVKTLDDILVSSLKTSEARLDYWYDIRDNLQQKFNPGEYYVDETGAHDEGPLFGSFLTTHGPAVTATMAGPGLFGSTIMFEGIDMVFAVPYPLPWPDLAREWITRERPSGWPSQELVQEVIADGCTLVPKGSKGSVLEDYEWRISFTGELRLARSLSRIQRQILHVLKALVSEPQHDLEMKAIDINLTEKIESFQFLNMMFQETEKLHQDQWNSKGFAHMLFHLIDRYLDYFEKGHMSHYFIKSRNTLEKFGDISTEDRDALRYTLHRIRNNPLEQILQQERYLRLKPESHKTVFAPFVEEVKSKGSIPQKLYVNTLVSLVLIHLLEKSYHSAYTYSMNALQFYQRISDDTLSDQEYMNLFISVALSCHRVGMPENVLEYLEKLHIVMIVRTKVYLIKIFGSRNYAELLVLLARTLTVNIGKEIQDVAKDKIIKNAIKLYHDALEVEPANMQIMIDLMNTLMWTGNRQQIDDLLREIFQKFPELEDLVCMPVEDNSHDQTDLDDAEIIYDRAIYIKHENTIDDEVTDTSQFDYLFGSSEIPSEQLEFCVQTEMEDDDTEQQSKDSRDHDILNDEEENENSDLKDEQSSKQMFQSEEVETKQLASANLGLDNVNDEKDFTDEDLWNIDRKLIRDYYMMKAFQEIRMKDKVEIIKRRIEIKMEKERQSGIKVSFMMLESLYKIYESTLRPKVYSENVEAPNYIVSDDEARVIYSAADKVLLDEVLVNLFTVFVSTVIRIPVQLLFSHLFIQFHKLQGNVEQAETAIKQMEEFVKTFRHAFDYAVGETILASHMRWLGDVGLADELFSDAEDRVQKSKDTVDPPSVKNQIFKWLQKVFSIVAVHEPYNRYLDQIFDV